MRTMTIAQAARWAGISSRMLGLMLTGRIVDSLSEIDLDTSGLSPELVATMPGREAGGSAVAAGGPTPGACAR